MQKQRAAIENFLYRRGIQAPVIRHLIATQILLTAGGIICGIPCAFFTWYPLLFGIGSGLAAYNFWHITFFVQGVTGAGYSKGTAIRMFLGFTTRLLVTGCILFGLIIVLHMPVFPIILGLASTIAGVIFWVVTKPPVKPAKEA